MPLISDCISVDPGVMAACLVNPGSGAAPGGSWSHQPTATCFSYDPEGMVECLTEGADLGCCFVAGIAGCVMLIDGESVTLS